MISFQNPTELLEFLRDRRFETNEWRRVMQEYAARNRCWYLGIQRSGNDVFQQSILGKSIEGAVNDVDRNLQRNGLQPLRVTLNKITENTISTMSATNPRKLDLITTSTHGIGKVESGALNDIVEAIGNATVEDSGALGVVRRANFERGIDGMHGFSHRIETSVSRDGRVDARQRAFCFDPYQITVDSNETDQDFKKHEWVIYSEVLTLNQARRALGERNMSLIDEASLPPISVLRSTELRYHYLTGGAMYPDLGHLSKQKGIVLHYLFLRGPSKRFDRMYIVTDTAYDVDGRSGGERTVLNWEANLEGRGNPYGGVGMPMHALYGYPKPGTIQGIADVAMQIDAQEKINIYASLFMQSVWNNTQQLIVVDPKGMNDSRTAVNDIRRQISEGVLMWSARTRDAKAPSVMQFAQPSQAIGQEIERHTRDLRESTFRTDTHVGRNSTHVADRTVARSVELSEIATEDRIDNDVSQYESFLESLTSTQIKLSQAGYATPARLLSETGLSDQQIGLMMRIDAERGLPRLKISEEAVRRRSRTRKIEDLQLLIQAGGMQDPTEARRIFAELDMPVSDFDKVMIQYANRVVADVSRGQPFRPVPLGPGASYMIQALQKAMAQTEDPVIARALRSAVTQQAAIESRQDDGQEPSLEEVVNTSFNENAVQA